jgi:putative heme iron utilization protein
MTRPARLLLRHAQSGVLSTHSLLHPGYPYGSALPCATDAQGRILILISNLAEHTKNILTDARVSFLVSPVDAQLLQRARITVVGDAQLLESTGRAQRRYLRLYPEAENYLKIGGFGLYHIEPRQARFIAGFGSMSWIDNHDLLAPPCALDDAEEDIIAHMNADHTSALFDYCRHIHQMESRQATMCAIDCDGFNIRTGESLLRFDFADSVANAHQAREQLVKLAQQCRR